jgi:quinoprotein glucose dehydrogenase
MAIHLVHLLLTLLLVSQNPTNAGQGPTTHAAESAPDHEWPVYGGDPGGTRYSPLADITPGTVSRLREAWTYRTGDFLQGPSGSRFQATPLMVEGRLIVSTPFGRVIALRPDTGDELWTFDPRVDLEGDYGDFANRGVAYWRDGPLAGSRRPTCSARVFVAPIDARLIALDANTGVPCGDFGARGTVDLQRDLVNAPNFKGEYQVTSPPAVLGDLVIVGSAIADNQRANAPSGVVRAFDVRTGALRWRWDPIPRADDEPQAATWRGAQARQTGAANAWSIMSVDEARDLVFVPVGSASPDFYGGERLGQNRHANSLVALRGRTGELVWAFQAVHHDLWDYDLASQPVLVTLQRDGKDVPAVVQGTKMGHVFVLHRDTGEPLFPVEERPVPKSDVPGEEAWPTQPFPTMPGPLVAQRLRAEDAWGITDADRAWCRERLAGLRSDGIFTPPSLQGTVIFPGNAGGLHWGGVSWDPVRRRLLAPVNNVAHVVRLVPRDVLDAARSQRPAAETSRQLGTPYGMQREVLLAPSGLPCNPPPWGTLTAIDLDAGSQAWQKPLGSFRAEHPDAEQWGSINLGAVLMTGGGLAFVAATFDGHLRAIEIETGDERWRSLLPAGGHALPMTYRYGGRQYIVMVAGGHPRMGVPASDHVVAFALDHGETSTTDTPAAATAWAGTYAGEFRGGRRRYDVEMRVTELADGGLTALVSLRDPKAAGTWQGVREGRGRDARVRWTGVLDAAGMNCSVRVDVPAALANRGRDMIGDGTVQGTCTEGRLEPASFSLRRTR